MRRRPGTLTLLAGLQGSGKTALMGQLAKAIGLRVMDSAVSRGMTPEQAQHEPGVAIFSLEASAEEIGLRLAAHEADMDGRDLMTGNLDMVAASNLSRALTRTRHMACTDTRLRGDTVSAAGAEDHHAPSASTGTGRGDRSSAGDGR